MSRTWALRALRWSYCAFIVYASALTFLQTWTGQGAHHGDPAILALSGVETAAALALAIEPLEVAALVALLAVYAVASAITVGEGEPPLRFVFYAVTALYIVLTNRGKPAMAKAAPP